MRISIETLITEVQRQQRGSARARHNMEIVQGIIIVLIEDVVDIDTISTAA